MLKLKLLKQCSRMKETTGTHKYFAYTIVHQIANQRNLPSWPALIVDSTTFHTPRASGAMAKSAEAKENNRKQQILIGLVAHQTACLSIFYHFVQLNRLLSQAFCQRWRLLWTWVPNLDFDDKRDFPLQSSPENDERNVIRFFQFVSKVMLLPNVQPIKKFCLKCDTRRCPSTDVSWWISAAMERKVEQLQLYVYFQCRFPHTLFNCKTIVILKLRKVELTNVPLSFYLPSLNTLHLVELWCATNVCLRLFFSGCPVLEDLVVADIRKPSWKQPQDVPICLSSHLTTVCFEEFKGWEYELHFTSYILKNARVLKTMTICCSSSNSKTRLNILKKLAALPRGSRCQLIFD
ncbi:FBD-associated F-box protein [Quillaja saponaria]|uniref:FBD-associated F-box protein n=1 Tax=Quillaja saponaria TaxID=32244 RepID=A0AAD7LP40_QUISA|nr:FBD-associated F-box protein [Quillaja saponaria]